MDSSESISFSMDTTTDSIDVMNHFSSTSKSHKTRQSPRKQQPQLPKSMLLREADHEAHEVVEESTSSKLHPDKEEFIVVDETPPPSAASTSSSASSATSTSGSSATSSSTLSAAPSAVTADFFSLSSQPEIESGQTQLNETTSSPTPLKKKHVLFDMVTVYHFNRSQGFTSIPSQGGSTLGMKRKHFLRRRLSVDLYEEVRRRSRREILLKIRVEKRKLEERERLRQQQQLNERLKAETASSSTLSTNTSDSDDNNDQATKSASGSTLDQDNIHVDIVGDDDDDDSYSDYSDISNSELESESYIFLQPMSVKLRRSLLRASGVGRIDPSEKRECNRIRTSRDRSGCQCVGQCIPKYCECSRLGVKCHVDRASFPCGCVADGCKNPEGRTEFDIARVRSHFEERLFNHQRTLERQ